MPDGISDRGVLTEHQIFWMLVKKARKRDDVGRVYLAIQAAIAYGQETVDVSWLTSAMMAEGQDTMNASAPRSLQFQQEYEREKRSLESRRAALLPNYRRTGRPPL